MEVPSGLAHCVSIMVFFWLRPPSHYAARHTDKPQLVCKHTSQKQLEQGEFLEITERQYFRTLGLAEIPA